MGCTNLIFISRLFRGFVKERGDLQKLADGHAICRIYPLNVELHPCFGQHDLGTVNRWHSTIRFSAPSRAAHAGMNMYLHRLEEVHTRSLGGYVIADLHAWIEPAHG